MKVSWLGTQVSSAFCLPPPPPSSYKKLLLEVKTKRGLPRPPAPTPCVAGGAKCPPGIPLPGQEIVGIAPAEPGEGWLARSLLRPGTRRPAALPAGTRRPCPVCAACAALLGALPAGLGSS